MTLRNQLEGGEEVSLNMRLQHGGGIYRAACDDDESRQHRAAEKAVELEWYIPPTQQEGGRQFHSYSHDQELTVMGLRHLL